MKVVKECLINNLKWIVVVICLVVFCLIGIKILNNDVIHLDNIVYQFFSSNLISDVITPIAKTFTCFGEEIFIGVAAILSLVFIKNRKIGLAICGNLAMVTGLNLVIKNIVQRPRPTGYRLIEETGYSFPSGHSMISMAFYGFAIYLICKYVKNKALKCTLTILLSLLIILIGASRIYLGVHYPSDVLGGFLISLAYVIVYIYFINKLVLR